MELDLVTEGIAQLVLKSNSLNLGPIVCTYHESISITYIDTVYVSQYDTFTKHALCKWGQREKAKPTVRNN